MYLYFNANGVLKEIINDDSIRQGSSNVNTIYAYFENTAITSARANIKFSDESVINASFAAEQELSPIPYNAERDLKYFRYDTDYQFYSYTLTSIPANGLCKMTIFGIITNDVVEAQGMVVFNIEDSVIASDITLSKAEYQDLLNLLESKEDKVNKSQVVDSSQVKYPSNKAVADALDPLVNRITSSEGNITSILNLLKDYLVSASVDSDTQSLNIVAKVNDATTTIIFKGGLWGKIGGDITDQTDLQNAFSDIESEIEQARTYIFRNATDIANIQLTLVKLDGIEAGAQVNAIEGVARNGVELTPDANKIVNVNVPTKTSDLTNDSNFATESFVNSSIATNTSYFLGSYNLVNDLHLSVSDTRGDVAEELGSVITSPTNNDYCFVQVPVSDEQPTVISYIDRYKYNAQDGEWLYEYTLNNSSFTASQWATINSGLYQVEVSATGSATDEVEYITINGTEKKIKSGTQVTFVDWS